MPSPKTGTPLATDRCTLEVYKVEMWPQELWGYQTRDEDGTLVDAGRGFETRNDAVRASEPMVRRLAEETEFANKCGRLWRSAYPPIGMHFRMMFYLGPVVTYYRRGNKVRGVLYGTEGDNAYWIQIHDRSDPWIKQGGFDSIEAARTACAMKICELWPYGGEE